MNDLIGFAEVLAGYFLYADTTMGIDVREHYSRSHTLIAISPLQTPFTSMRLLYYMHKRQTVPPIIKYLLSRNSYVCLIWIFIFETDQAHINSVTQENIILQRSWVQSRHPQKEWI